MLCCDDLDLDLDSTRVDYCLSRVAALAYFQASPNLRQSFLTASLQFVLGQPGPLPNPGTVRYSAGSAWPCYLLVVNPTWDACDGQQLTTRWRNVYFELSQTYIANHVTARLNVSTA